MADSKNINYIVLAFVLLILGSVLITEIAVQTNERTDKVVIASESHDLEALGCVIAGAVGGEVNGTNILCNVSVTNAPTSWKITDCPLTSVTVRNGTSGHTFTLNTDYYLYANTGIVNMVNNTGAGGNNGSANTTVFDYTYCADDYMNSSWGRTILDLVPGFFALALLGIGIWLLYAVFKENGILS